MSDNKSNSTFILMIVLAFVIGGAAIYFLMEREKEQNSVSVKTPGGEVSISVDEE